MTYSCPIEWISQLILLQVRNNSTDEVGWDSEHWSNLSIIEGWKNGLKEPYSYGKIYKVFCCYFHWKVFNKRTSISYSNIELLLIMIFITVVWKSDHHIGNYNTNVVHNFKKYLKFDAIWNIKLGKWKWLGLGIDPMYVIWFLTLKKSFDLGKNNFAF